MSACLKDRVLIKDELLSANLFSHGLGVSKILQVQCSQSLQCGNNKQLLNDLKFVDVPRFFLGGEVKKTHQPVTTH